MMLAAHKSDLRVRTRVLQLVAALEQVGAVPIGNRDLHALAYLANILSPIWEVEPLEKSVLKERNGPRSSIFEHEIDLCVGTGFLKVEKIQVDPEIPTRLEAFYRLNRAIAQPVLDIILSLPDEREVSSYLNELAFVFVEIKPEKRDDAVLSDAAWSNPSVVNGRIIDFGERLYGRTSNPAYNVAQAFQQFAPQGINLNRAEKLIMYVRLLKRRAHG